MPLRLFRHLVLTAAAATALGAVMSAQGKPAYQFDIPPQQGEAEFSCTFEQGTSVAIMQGNTLRLVVSVTSPAGNRPPYQLTNARPFTLGSDAGSKALEISTPRSKGTPTVDNVDYRRTERFVFTVKIAPDAPPISHEIELTFEAPNRPPVSRTIALYVGSGQDKFIEARVDPEAPRITAGQEQSVALKVANSFPAYDATIHRVEITSEPAGLFDKVSLTPKVVVPAQSAVSIDVPVRANRSWWLHLVPIDVKPKMNVSIHYDDGYRTVKEREPKIPITFAYDVNPFWFAVFSVASLIVGGIAGAWLRIRLSAASVNENRLTITERFVASLILAGAIVLLVVTARVEVLSEAAAISLPLHKPVSVLLIAFLVGLYDPTTLIDRLKGIFRIGGTTERPAATGGH